MEWIGVCLIWFIGHGPIAGALILALFWAALAHPERIRSLPKFRLAALCVGVSIAAGVLIPVALMFYYTSEGRDGRPNRRGGDFNVMLNLCSLPPILTMLGFLLGIDSVLPKRARPDTAAAPAREAQPTEPR